MTLDVGGTSADIGIVRDGRPVLSSEEHIAEFPVLIPTVAVSSIGAGGGSIIWLDPTGSLKVGPRSVGADPGPACYGTKGSLIPALTDAFLVAGLLEPGQRLGGKLPLQLSPARDALGTIASTAHQLGGGGRGRGDPHRDRHDDGGGFQRSCAPRRGCAALSHGRVRWRRPFARRVARRRAFNRYDPDPVASRRAQCAGRGARRPRRRPGAAGLYDAAADSLRDRLAELLRELEATASAMDRRADRAISPPRPHAPRSRLRCGMMARATTLPCRSTAHGSPKAILHASARHFTRRIARPTAMPTKTHRSG